MSYYKTNHRQQQRIREQKKLYIYKKIRLRLQQQQYIKNNVRN